MSADEWRDRGVEDIEELEEKLEQIRRAELRPDWEDVDEEYYEEMARFEEESPKGEENE